MHIQGLSQIATVKAVNVHFRRSHCGLHDFAESSAIVEQCVERVNGAADRLERETAFVDRERRRDELPLLENILHHRKISIFDGDEFLAVGEHREAFLPAVVDVSIVCNTVNLDAVDLDRLAEALSAGALYGVAEVIVVIRVFTLVTGDAICSCLVKVRRAF